MYDLKPIRPDAVPAALQKAERYRLLNQPREAESICRDVLAVDPGNPQARAALVLALTDQFASDARAMLVDALDSVERLDDEYERTYLTGLVYERWAKAQLARGTPAHALLGWLRDALGRYEQAAALAPPGDDEAVLRWNACVRLIRDDPRLGGVERPHAAVRHAHEMPLD